MVEAHNNRVSKADHPLKVKDVLPIQAAGQIVEATLSPVRDDDSRLFP